MKRLWAAILAVLAAIQKAMAEGTLGLCWLCLQTPTASLFSVFGKRFATYKSVTKMAVPGETQAGS